MFEYVDNFDGLIDSYQVFLFDQFGVLHNGKTTYARMPPVLASLKKHNKLVAVISNSGKRAAVNTARLEALGYGAELINRVYTSGEIARFRLQELTANRSAELPLGICYFGSDEDRSALEGLAVSEHQTPEHAQLIIFGGMGQTQRSEGEYRELLQAAVDLRVPAYCTNPDLMSFDGDGVLVRGPGRLAGLYEEMGGDCEYFGKPHPELYRHVLTDLGIAPQQALCIGDSIEHDVLGARRAGCGSMLVRTGVHSMLNDLRLQALMQELSVWPDYVLNQNGVGAL